MPAEGLKETSFLNFKKKGSTRLPLIEIIRVARYLLLRQEIIVNVVLIIESKMKKKNMQGKLLKAMLLLLMIGTGVGSSIFVQAGQSAVKANKNPAIDTIPTGNAFRIKADSLLHSRQAQNHLDSLNSADSLVHAGIRKDYLKDSLKLGRQEKMKDSIKQAGIVRTQDSIKLNRQNRSSSSEVNNEVNRKPRINYYAGKNMVLGLHTGLNFARATNSSGNIISKPSTGLLAGIFYQHGLKLFGGRTELNYSRQGFHYNSDGTIGQITNDYISMVTMTTVTIFHRAQLQFGSQQGFLINSKDSQGGGAGKANAINSFNRFDFGLAAGIEAYPYLGVLVGLRYNLGLTNLVKRPDNSVANYIPYYQLANSYNIHNGVFQLYVGYQFPL